MEAGKGCARAGSRMVVTRASCAIRSAAATTFRGIQLADESLCRTDRRGRAPNVLQPHVKIGARRRKDQLLPVFSDNRQRDAP